MERDHAYSDGFNVSLGGLVLAVVAWHGVSIVRVLGPDYLFSMCYLANIILAAGVILRSGLLLGTGFGWALVALPLWAINSWVTGQVSLSSMAFHTTGIGVGFLALRRTVLPRWIVLVAVPAGFFSYLLARAFTEPSHNINAAFRVQQGWEWMFSDVRAYVLAQLLVYSSVFLLVPVMSNRLVYAGESNRA